MADGLVADAGATWRQALSVSAATGAYGVSFGALAVAAGLSVGQASALSLLMFTGGSQFAYVGVVAAGGGAGPATATAALLGARNGLYGLQLAHLLRLPARLRPVAAHVTIDESTAVALGQAGDRLQRLGFWATGLGVLVLWNASTLVGALAGDALGDPRAYGLDAAAAAAFLGLLWPRLRGASATARATAGAAAAVALALTPLVPPGLPVLAAAVVAVVAGWRAA